MSEELKVELFSIKEKNRQLFLENVLPGIKEKVEEFLSAFEDYFRERGFVVKNKNGSVRAAFDSLEFNAFSNERQDIFITKEKEPIASISVKVKDTPNLNAYIDSQENHYGDSIEQLKTEIEKEKAATSVLEKPIFYYTGSEFGRQYDSPAVVLESIFHV